MCKFLAMRINANGTENHKIRLSSKVSWILWRSAWMTSRCVLNVYRWWIICRHPFPLISTLKAFPATYFWEVYFKRFFKYIFRFHRCSSSTRKNICWQECCSGIWLNLSRQCYKYSRYLCTIYGAGWWQKYKELFFGWESFLMLCPISLFFPYH